MYQCTGIRAATLLRVFVLPPGFTPGGEVEPPAAPSADVLVHAAFWHVMLVCAAVVVHVVRSMLLVVALRGGCRWNLSSTTFVLSSASHVAAYFNAS